MTEGAQSHDAPPMRTTRGRPPTLTVSFLDQRHVISAPAHLSFGRSADLVVDTNPSLHRIVGVFFWHDGLWYLANHSTSTALELVDADSTSSMRIAPGASASLGFRRGTLGFSVAGAHYSIDLETTRNFPSLDDVTQHDPSGEVTRREEALPLTPEQRLLIIALAEPSLRHGSPRPVPTNREAANGLGWSPAKFNRKLDSVCAKLARGGVSGLTGSVDRLARDRRERLVEYSIDSGLVTADDLGLLEANGR